MALSAIGVGAEAAVPSLVSALDHEESNVRLNGAYALGMIGIPAGEAPLRLQSLANDEDTRVRQAAAEAMAKMEVQPSP